MWKYEVWQDGSCLTESDFIYESAEEAEEEGVEAAEDKIALWKIEGAYDGETLEDFDIRLKED